MTISRAEASRLLKLALARNYEPAVRQALGAVPQHAFDGAVSFHFTEAIGRAAWVGAYKTNDTAGVRSRLALWTKGGGRVLPGLQRRRREEADAILLDRWPNDLRVASDPAPLDPRFAAFVISVTGLEITEIREAFREVGFEPGVTIGKVDRQAVLDFQRQYGLTVDGLIGRQTLSSLQRELDARRKSKEGGAGAAGGAAVAGGNEAVAPAPTVEPSIIGDPWITAGGIGVAAIAFPEHHADAVAVQRRPQAAGAEDSMGAPDYIHRSLLRPVHGRPYGEGDLRRKARRPVKLAENASAVPGGFASAVSPRRRYMRPESG
jgi:lysozyme